MRHHVNGWKKYADFRGRARRRDYWLFTVVNGIAGLALGHVLHLPSAEAAFLVINLFPTLAVMVRRLHDTGHSAWCLLWYLFPLVGAIVMLVHLYADSDGGMNRYGPSPKSPAPTWDDGPLPSDGTPA